MFGGTLFVDAKGKKEYCGYIIKLYKTINSPKGYGFFSMDEF